MDGGVLIRRVVEVQLISGPVGAAHGANRQIDQPAVCAIGRDVDNVVRAHLAGEVPGGANVGAQREGYRVGTQRFDFTAFKDARGDDRTLDPAVENHLPDRFPTRLFAAGGRDQEGRVAAHDDGGVARVSDLAGRGVEGVGIQ